MQIYANKLEAQLKQPLSAVYLIAGDELLLKNDACDAIRKVARKQGFDGGESMTYETGFDWNSLLESGNTLSLFAEKKLLELRLSSSKIGTQGSEAICRYLTNAPQDTILLIHSPRIDGKPKWLKACIGNGTYVPIYPVDTDKLPAWLSQRARQYKLTLSRDAAILLAERVEGNLTAATQELEKLALLVPDGKIDATTVGRAVADNARFSTFNMLDHAIEGNAAAASRALRHLKEDGESPPAIIGALAHQLRTLRQLKQFEQKGMLYEGFQSLRVIKKKQAAMSQTVSRLSSSQLANFVTLAAKADILGKSADNELAWNSLEIIVLGIAGITVPTLELHLKSATR